MYKLYLYLSFLTGIGYSLTNGLADSCKDIFAKLRILHTLLSLACPFANLAFTVSATQEQYMKTFLHALVVMKLVRGLGHTLIISLHETLNVHTMIRLHVCQRSRLFWAKKSLYSTPHKKRLAGFTSLLSLLENGKTDMSFLKVNVHCAVRFTVL